MTWADSYDFREPLIDLRGVDESAEALAEELDRELVEGHPLHGRQIRVIARAEPNDDIVVAVDDEVAVVSLTWTHRKTERPPLPKTVFLTSSEELDAYAEGLDAVED